MLVIDDDDFVRDLITEILLPPDYEVRVTAAGGPGLQTLQREGADLVLLDVDLGAGQSGFQVCAQIMQLANPPAVIFLTSHAEEDFVRAGMEAGASAYLCKPFSPLELLGRIMEVKGLD